MGYKHQKTQISLEMFSQPSFTLKVIPHVDCSPRVLQLVQMQLSNVAIQGAWIGPPALSIRSHAMARDELPIIDVVSAVHVIADSTLGPAMVIKDYLSKDRD
jgi:acetoacetate decarboxylase